MIDHLGSYDVIVVGAGHAGIEAAHAAAILGARTAVFTLTLDFIGNMPCNPSIGGTAKGHLVREIDALGGLMGIAADATFLQSRMLNRGKGPAVHSLRVQTDRKRYHMYMKHALELTPNLDIHQAEIVGIDVQDGQAIMVDARLIKNEDEIELLKCSAAMVDAAYWKVAKNLHPGVTENEMEALIQGELFRMGAESVEFVNCISGIRGNPHSHTTSNRMIRRGELVYFDIGNVYNGYRTCYYRTFSCGNPTKAQEEAYTKALKWIYDGIAQIKPGNTSADVAAVWPSAQELGFNNEEEAFLLQFAHGIGLGLWEKPVISRLFSLEHPYEFKPGMTFAIETWCPSADGTGSARIEEEIVVTETGHEIITKFPVEEITSCGFAGCMFP